MKKLIVITIVTFALVSLVSCASAQGIVASDLAYRDKVGMGVSKYHSPF